MSFVAVVMAAGKGTRMRSQTPKVLHPICGRAMVQWPILAAQEAGAERVVVVGGPEGELEGLLPRGVELGVQPVADGTGGAVAAVTPLLEGAETIVVVNGDCALITAEALSGLVAAHEAAGAGATLATTVLEDPAGYGRVVRGPDGSVERVVETKTAGDADAEQLLIDEVNGGVYAFDGVALREALPGVRPANAQGERYLPDVLPLIRAAGGTVAAHLVADPELLAGVNDRVELAHVTAVAQRRLLEAHMRAGVTVLAPEATVVEAGVAIGPDTVLEPGTVLRGATSIGEGATIGPASTLIDTEVGDGAVLRHSYCTGAVVGDGVSVGPFAYLRPGTVLRTGAKVGTFVEVKNSDIGARSKVPHLSYIGDADVGEDSNLGAATITANYDGRRKHRTTIGARVRSSVDVSFVAPVRVGDDAYTAAGSVITEDVPAGGLGIARSRQTNIDGYAERREAATQAAEGKTGQ